MSPLDHFRGWQQCKILVLSKGIPHSGEFKGLEATGHSSTVAIQKQVNKTYPESQKSCRL